METKPILFKEIILNNADHIWDNLATELFKLNTAIMNGKMLRVTFDTTDTSKDICLTNGIKRVTLPQPNPLVGDLEITLGKITYYGRDGGETIWYAVEINDVTILVED